MIPTLITGFQGNVMVHKRKVHGFTAVQKPGRYPRAEIVEQSEGQRWGRAEIGDQGGPNQRSEKTPSDLGHCPPPTGELESALQRGLGRHLDQLGEGVHEQQVLSQPVPW